jgi:hypothetical protein
MKKAVFLLATTVVGQLCENEDYYAEKEWPESWDPEPRYRMNDCVYLPKPYGTGSSTTRDWIEK